MHPCVSAGSALQFDALSLGSSRTRLTGELPSRSSALQHSNGRLLRFQPTRKSSPQGLATLGQFDIEYPQNEQDTIYGRIRGR